MRCSPIGFFEEEEEEVIAVPRGDRTGPMGYGPRSGRAAGFCAGYPVPGYLNPVPRWGFRRAWRMHAYTFPWYAPPYHPVYHPPGIPGYYPAELSKQQEKAILEDQARVLEDQVEALKSDLEEIQRRIDELKRREEEDD